MYKLDSQTGFVLSTQVPGAGLENGVDCGERQKQRLLRGNRQTFSFHPISNEESYVAHFGIIPQCHKVGSQDPAARWRCSMCQSLPCSLPLPWKPLEGRPGMSESSPAVWNLRAVIWFHFTIFSLVLLPTPIFLRVLSFFLPTGPFSWLFFPENSSTLY